MSTTAARRGRPKIKPPRRHGPDVSIEKTWADLAHNIREIQNHNAPNLSFEENHRFAYNLVLHKHGEMLYNGVIQLIAEDLDNRSNEHIFPAFPSGSSDPTVQGQEAEMLLKALRRVWDDHTSNMVRLGQILKYMDRVYTKSAQVPEIWDAGLSLFLKHIIRPPIQDQIVAGVLSQIHSERDGYVVNRSGIKGCVDVLLTLQVQAGTKTVYQRDLEPLLLKESEVFYKAEGKRLLESCDASEYLRKVESRLESEDSRTHHYLSRNTAAPLRQILQDNLLTAHLSSIVSMENSGLDVMIDLNKIPDMARLYRLFLSVTPGMACLKRAVRDSIRRRGEAINHASSGMEEGENGEKPTKTRAAAGAQTLTLALKWVQDVLDLKDLFDKIWTEAFSNDHDLEEAINETFQSFVNSNERASEFISLFIDDHLKRGLKGKTDMEVDLVLDKSITVFRYLTEKDVFERYYKGHLAKRLLHGRSVSDDAEQGMLAKLKVECGYQFTQKLEGMFNDIKISEETMKAYKRHLASTSAPQIDISVIVMTSTFWPSAQSDSGCTLPLAMINATRSFELFYLSRHSGRRLTWQPTFGNADVRVTFKARKHDLNVATLAHVIIVYLLRTLIPLQEIKQATSIADPELQRHLQSLACAKFKVLKKHPPGRDVHPSDSFSFNNDFTSNLQKIKISTISSRVESGEEQKETRDRIDEERRHQTEACIVRIMKSRKHMTHNDLVTEVTRQLAGRFLPNPLIIKKRIEGLIEREYLERCTDRKSYNYMVSHSCVVASLLPFLGVVEDESAVLVPASHISVFLLALSDPIHDHESTSPDTQKCIVPERVR
ncbi:CULLIN-2 domain-containing protein [Mycena indigotica]|uniref:CULLIN-2 domain-containing protein n=1 Tax=Mycena indigotica TaxID=2126181 RepID=A0A8H6T8H8_9AGAR|nr:CULLIN-2 domain-containing protein [Mycena indigotica]KAF7312292.1 CULLIN-2 domain-containing protein [Mycena indigotica]